MTKQEDMHEFKISIDVLLDNGKSFKKTFHTLLIGKQLENIKKNIIKDVKNYLKKKHPDYMDYVATYKRVA